MTVIDIKKYPTKGASGHEEDDVEALADPVWVKGAVRQDRRRVEAPEASTLLGQEPRRWWSDLTCDSLVGFRWFGVSFRWYCGVGGLVVGHQEPVWGW